MAIHKLTTTKVAHAKPGKHEDGGGLRLVVSNSRSKRWIHRYTAPNGKRRETGLGSLDVVSLSQARQKAQEFRQLLASGIDPIEAKKASARNSFKGSNEPLLRQLSVLLKKLPRNSS